MIVMSRAAAALWRCCSQLSPANRDEGTSSNREGRVASMIANKTGTHLGTAPHLVQIFRQPQTRPNPLDEVQPADLAHMIRQPRYPGMSRFVRGIPERPADACR